MKALNICLIFLLCAGSFCFAQEGLLLDDFEGVISGGAEGTVDYGSGNGSSIEVTADTTDVKSGKQALKIVYDAVNGGYMYAAKGSGLDAKNTAWLVKPEDIDWKNFKSISFYMLGTGNKAQIAFDLKDSGNEIFRYIVADDFTGWKQIICPFDSFSARSDWQPDGAEKNDVIDYPVKSYQFEPLPEAKGSLVIDKVELE